MLARSSLALLALSLVGCVVETVPCAMAPDDPACPRVDSGAMDGGRDGAAPDGAPDGGGDGGPCGLCMGATPVCVADMCVACGDDADCTGDDRCDLTDHTCVACLGTAGDACPASTVCDTTTNECVGCLTNTDCTTVGASVCNTGTQMCEACNAVGECSHLTATPACDITAGTCVLCSATEQTACPSGVCLIGTSACAPAGGAAAPCTSCVRDTDCRAGQLCVPMTYDDPRTPAADPTTRGG